MWEPDPEWVPLPGVGGPATAGLWRTRLRGRECVVKRLRAPGPGDPEYLHDPGHVGYWRRSADVALSGMVTQTPGVRALPCLRVDPDPEGITLVEEWVPTRPVEPLVLAEALGRFSRATLPSDSWLARDLLRTRLRLTQARGGWRLLRRTPAAELADRMWRERSRYLAAYDALPQVLCHGDPTPANLPGYLDESVTPGAVPDVGPVVGIDWSALGVGPVGSDLGYLALSVKGDVEPLLAAYALVADRAPELVRLGAGVMAVYTALSRAEWALARVEGGDGNLNGKLRHPAVAPYLRALRRLQPWAGYLLDG